MTFNNAFCPETYPNRDGQSLCWTLVCSKSSSGQLSYQLDTAFKFKTCFCLNRWNNSFKSQLPQGELRDALPPSLLWPQTTLLFNRSPCSAWQLPILLRTLQLTLVYTNKLNMWPYLGSYTKSKIRYILYCILLVSLNTTCETRGLSQTSPNAGGIRCG